jgi:drug/metabolite transporter (DMT)-like permease
MSTRRGDRLLLAVGAVAVSTSAPLVRVASAPSFAIAAWRNLLAAAVLVPYALANRDTRHELRRMPRSDRRRCAVAGLLLAAHFGTWLPSLSFTTVASSVALVTTSPVWTALAARAKGEHVPRAAWVGIGLTLAGVLVLTGVDFAVSARALAGDALALAGGVLASGYLLVGVEVRRTVSTTAYTAICYLVAGAVLLAVCIASSQRLAGYDAATWLCLGAMVAGPQLLGHSVFNKLLRTTSAWVVAVTIVSEVVGSTLLAFAFLGETPPALVVPAAALVMAGVVVVVRADATPPVVPAVAD